MSRTKRVFKSKPLQDKDMKNKRPDRSCNNHGSCPVCEGNRTFGSKHRQLDGDIE
jgi:hypothetical protein